MKTRVLHVHTPYWSARCRWVFRDGKWEGVIFDKQLNFLKGLTPEQCKVELEKLGAKWTWGKVEDKPAPSVA